MCSLDDTLQDKVDEMLGEIEGVKIYINDLLVLSKKRFYKHIEQLRITYSTLHVDYIRFSFGLKEITYIGYVITQEEIKPDLKKVKGITYIGRSTTRTEAREIIGMVHYYRYM